MKEAFRKRQSFGLLEGLWAEGLTAVHPRSLIRPSSEVQDSAFLFWGKAAAASWEALKPNAPSLVVSSEPRPKSACLRTVHWVQAEHPTPGPGSFQAGQCLLEFFDGLRRLGDRRLEIYLSGGASSLAWLAAAGLRADELQSKLAALYRQPLSIAELNARRARLCGLKLGGAARWLNLLAPKIKAQVHLISDVAPYSLQWVGSGPFWNSQIPHHRLADNATLVGAIQAAAHRRGVSVLGAHSAGWAGSPGGCEDWIRGIEKLRARARTPGLFILGGEPHLRLPPVHGKGGRLSHLAGRLAQTYREVIQAGDLKILAASSDGVDGTSGQAGAWVDQKTLPSARALAQALCRYDTGSLLMNSRAAYGSGRPTGTNVQDVVMLNFS